MNHDDHMNSAQLARRAGIDRRRAKSSAWNSGASFRDKGARVVTEREGDKIVARQRFAQRVAQRYVKQREEIADSLRPRVSVDLGGAK